MRDPSAAAGPIEPVAGLPSRGPADGTSDSGHESANRRRFADRRLQALAVFLLFLLISVFLWGLPLLPHFASTLAYQRRHGYATNNDVRLFAWSLAWWPHAIGHGSNPFHSTFVWAPRGVDMAWVTGVPGPSLAAAPFTLAFGPVFSENLLFLLGPALAGWAAYLLCRRVVDSFWASVAGGFLFGFSAYMSAQMVGHLHAVLVFPVPLAAYLVLRRLDGTLSPVRFVALMALTLLAELSISTEILGTLVLFGAIAMAGAFVGGSPEVRKGLLSVTRLVAVAGVIVLVLASPFVYYVLQNSHPVAYPPPTAFQGPGTAADLAAFVVPTPVIRLGGQSYLHSMPFTHGQTALEAGAAYLGLPLMLFLVLFAAEGWRRRPTWLLLGLLGVIVLLSLGPALVVNGHRRFALPWRLVSRIRVVDQMLPARFTLFMWLTLAVMVALWLARTNRMRWVTWGRAALIVVAALFLLPAARLHAPADPPPFFADGTYHRYLVPGETVMSIPFRKPADFQLWQAQVGFPFRLTGGYVGPLAVPRPYLQERLSIVLGWGGRIRPNSITLQELTGFIRERGVGAILVEDSQAALWEPLFSQLGVEPVDAGGITVYPLRPGPTG